MWRNVLKFFGIILVIAILGVGVLLGVQYVRYRNSPEYRAEQDLKILGKQYAEDPYGGETPEETLRLFIDALKTGDTELAAKYFVLDKQEQWQEDLAKIKGKGLLDEMVRDLEREKSKYQISDGQIGFDVANEQKEAILSIRLGRGPSDKWKILDL
ncbi:MAG: hypothetical protein HYW91_00950 [Candidatus Sungbacteria bacterium]|nr:hypothetical protein [Candidatus Sungbacteria bacterium]